MDIKIIVATHKQYKMPKDPAYFPIFVGSALHPELAEKSGYVRDDGGENISAMNPEFCELTGLYYFWKNLSADTIGLVHYRRYFKGNYSGEGFKGILSSEEIEQILEKKEMIIPLPRKYYIETLYSHYSHTHFSEHLDKTREIIEKKYPEYLGAFDRVMKKRSGAMFNMMIVKKEFLDRYCEWLFSILFDLKERFSHILVSPYQLRYCGRISEILLNVFLEYEKEKDPKFEEKICKRRLVNIEKINYFKKVSSFLKAKFMHKKYEESF